MAKRRVQNNQTEALSLTAIRLNAAEQAAIQIVLDTLPSEHSKHAYERALREFFLWRRQNGNTTLNKALVQAYAANLREINLNAASLA